jgi:transposase
LSTGADHGYPRHCATVSRSRIGGRLWSRKIDLGVDWVKRGPSRIYDRYLKGIKHVDRQLRDLENCQRRDVRDDDVFAIDQVQRLLDLKGIGPVTAWLLVREVFGWRQTGNHR